MRATRWCTTSLERCPSRPWQQHPRLQPPTSNRDAWHQPCGYHQPNANCSTLAVSKPISQRQQAARSLASLHAGYRQANIRCSPHIVGVNEGWCWSAIKPRQRGRARVSAAELPGPLWMHHCRPVMKGNRPAQHERREAQQENTTSFSK